MLNLQLTNKNSILHFIKSILPFKSYDTHVKISKAGHAMINNKKRLSETVDAIMANKQDLESGKLVKINENTSIESVASIPADISK